MNARGLLREKTQTFQYDNHLGSACLELEMHHYAAWLCRFINVDPLQFKYPYYTPFQYAGNKPITYIDLDGGEEDKKYKLDIANLKTNLYENYNESDQFGGLGVGINFKRSILNGNYVENSIFKNEKKNISYKREIINGELVSPDIKQNRIKIIEQGELKKVKGIVLHRTAGPSAQSAINSFISGRDGIHYGTHFVIDKDGSIIQTANLTKKTWHVGDVVSKIYPTSSFTIGIEVSGNYNKSTKTWDPLTKEQVIAVANLVNYLLEAYQLDSNTDIYCHDVISKKMHGEGTVVLEAIKNLIVNPKNKTNLKISNEKKDSILNIHEQDKTKVVKTKIYNNLWKN
jgi:RHS repeat-associated protein